MKFKVDENLPAELADLRAFGLTWEDCESMLRQLGFAVHLTIEAVYLRGTQGIGAREVGF